MIGFEEFQKAITGFESTVHKIDHDNGIYRVIGEISPGVDFMCTIRSTELRDDLDIKDQLDHKAYEMFIKAIE